MPSYSVEYSPQASETLKSLDESILPQIRAAIKTKLMTDPAAFGKPLRYSLKNQRTLRVGEWRLIFEISKNVVTIISVFHRSKGY